MRNFLLDIFVSFITIYTKSLPILADKAFIAVVTNIVLPEVGDFSSILVMPAIRWDEAFTAIASKRFTWRLSGV
jgi:hypothetical protein